MIKPNRQRKRKPAPETPRETPTETPTETPAQTTHFGYSDVPVDEKASLVHDVFADVAENYDLMNDLMSMGIHRWWKSAFMNRLNPQPGMRLLDVGGGTGDIAFAFLARGGGAATVCDINAEMLEVGRRRAIDRGILDNLDWTCGNAENLPVSDASVEAYTTAFCIRNVTDIPAALREARRVLKPGGRFMCLEFSHVVLPVFDKLYDAYSFNVLPALGQLIAGNREAYQYLAESIRKFPTQDRFADMIADAGLGHVTYHNLSGGIAAIHSAWRI
ncbi:MAG: bifunctional demethylmenaquinone methyltransferase/2-methoxy-6-polyprenyl-1,4-benzoquinol methylase UbiE [Rhodospirillales bacterium]|nr:bifunctional demethylmenaquinone methyltransferase/2-methoxy-6-polyprenyl-1,4-benzoquinol methylase UbiE [Rhodospirillales bacterium]